MRKTATYFRNKEEGNRGRSLSLANGVLPTILTIFITFYAAPVFLTSCTDRLAADRTEFPDSVSTRINWRIAAERARLQHMDLFFYQTDSLGRLDSYQRTEKPDGSAIEGCSRSGDRIVVALGNVPAERLRWEDIQNYHALRRLSFDLCDEEAQSPVLVAATRCRAGSGSGCGLDLHPVSAEVELHSIACDFHGMAYEGEELTDVKVYLTNVRARCNWAGEEDTPIQTDLLNTGRLEQRDLDRLRSPELIYRELGTVGASVLHPDIRLRCYPNSARTESLGNPLTRLVIEGRLQGETVYYPINLGTPEDGLEGNVRYRMDITLTRKGMTDPDQPAASGEVQVCCTVLPWEDHGETEIRFGRQAAVQDPDEDRISDLNLYLFDENGLPEAHRYIPAAQLEQWPEDVRWRFRMIRGKAASLYVLANAGYDTGGFDSEERLKEFRYHLVWPDDYRTGMPMAGQRIRFFPGDTLEVRLRRLMAKVSVRLQRDRLYEDVYLEVESVRLGGCPRSVRVFAPSRAEDEEDVFELGFSRNGPEVAALNRTLAEGRSGEISLYVLENLQGNLLSGIRQDADKVFPPDSRYNRLCTHLELLCTYRSPLWRNKVGEYLRYRSFLGGSRDNFDLRRGCHYPVCIRPVGSGLAEESWRVDKSGLEAAGSPAAILHPGQYIEGHSGDTVHVWCELIPRDTPLVIDRADLDYDRERGIYDYELDADGHGVRLFLKKGGSGMFNVDAGDPVNSGFLVFLLVDP